MSVFYICNEFILEWIIYVLVFGILNFMIYNSLMRFMYYIVILIFVLCKYILYDNYCICMKRSKI